MTRVPLVPILALLSAAALAAPGCVAHMDFAAGDDDTTGDNDATGDDDATDDDDTGDDDTTGDDDATDDDDAQPDFSDWQASFVMHLDFSPEAEDYLGAVDCDATYDQVGPNVSGSYSDLCPSCDHVFELHHAANPAEETVACVEQAMMSGDDFTRYYGIEMVSDTEFVVWRNWDDTGTEPLEAFGGGTIDGTSFSYALDPIDYYWGMLIIESEATGSFD